MQPRPSGDPPPDRLARLLVDARDGAGPGGPEVDAPWEVPHADADGGGGRHRASRVPLLSVPASLRSAELRVGPRAVRGLLLLVVVAAAVLGGRWVWAQLPASALDGQRVVSAAPQPEEAGAAEGTAGSEGTAGTEETEGMAGTEGTEGTAAGTAGTAGTADGTVAEDLVVHVTGQVRDPGVVELPAGSRVVDAVRAAGGLTDQADQSTVNLARALVDGEQLWVGRPGEEPPAGWAPPAAAPGGAAGGGGAGGAGGGADPPPLDLNTATQADLEELPGVGPVTAGHILAWRDEHGRFSRVEELLEVSGIGERTLAQLEPLVTVGG